MQTASNNTKRPQGAATRRGSRPVAGLRFGVRLGLLTVAVLAVTRLLGLVWTSARARVADPGPASAGELLALGASGLAIGVAAWLVLGTGLELAAHLPGRVGRAARLWSGRVTPALARRTAGFVLGVGVGVVGGPAQAVAAHPVVVVAGEASTPDGRHAPDPGFQVTRDAAGSTTTTPPTTTTAADTDPSPTDREPVDGADLVTPGTPVEPGFTPAAPRVRPQADPGLLGARVTATTVDEVVVHRGDSLWSIAARHLGADASDAEVDRSWREWFALNRDRIGADPDLILPGQVLRAPGPDPSGSTVR